VKDTSTVVSTLAIHLPRLKVVLDRSLCPCSIACTKSTQGFGIFVFLCLGGEQCYLNLFSAAEFCFGQSSSLQGPVNAGVGRTGRVLYEEMTEGWCFFAGGGSGLYQNTKN